MTNKEMVQMRLDGVTYQEIADICGITRQAARDSVTRYFKKVINAKRGRNFSCEEIVYEGIYEHFMEDENETVTSFAIKVYEGGENHSAKMRSFLKGENASSFTIAQIKRMCEIVGKPFEETFKEREG